MKCLFNIEKEEEKRTIDTIITGYTKQNLSCFLADLDLNIDVVIQSEVINHNTMLLDKYQAYIIIDMRMSSAPGHDYEHVLWYSLQFPCPSF